MLNSIPRFWWGRIHRFIRYPPLRKEIKFIEWNWIELCWMNLCCSNFEGIGKWGCTHITGELSASDGTCACRSCRTRNGRIIWSSQYYLFRACTFTIWLILKTNFFERPVSRIPYHTNFFDSMPGGCALLLFWWDHSSKTLFFAHCTQNETAIWFIHYFDLSSCYMRGDSKLILEPVKIYMNSKNK